MTAVDELRRADDSVSRWVCFDVGGQRYGVPILSVQEVLRAAQIEPVPGAGAQVLGVINLRGSIVTVLDLRARLGLGAASAGTDTRIVILDHGGESVGLLVDRVADVRKIVDAAVKPAPDVGAAGSAVRAHGLYTRDGDLLTLLDPASLIDGACFVA